MNLIPNKPYVWVERGEDYPTIKFIYDIEEHLTFTSSEPEISTNEDTAFLDYYITDAGAPLDPANLRTFPLDSGLLEKEKITVRIFNEARELTGFHTVKPLTGNFEIEGEEPHPIPYIYLKVIDTSNLKVNVATDFKIGVRFDQSRTEDTQIILNFDNYTVTKKLIYFLDPDAEPGVDFQTIELNKDNYDPVLEDIIVEVVVLDTNENTDRKGHGTTHGSEGDASGEG